MAQVVSVSVYGLNSGSIGTAQGITMGFPTQGIVVRPAPVGASSVFNGVTALTIVQLLPTATKVGADQYYTPTATATVITACNA